MGKLSFSNQAREDLFDIWRYIAEQSPHAADRVFELIEDRCQVLKPHPNLGRIRPEIGPGARALVIERWIAFYRLVDGGVQVVRIIDGARDLTHLEWTEAL